jgi:hypothetical protein
VNQLNNNPAEHTLIGSIIADPSLLDELIDKLEPRHFSNSGTATIYGAICSLTLSTPLTPAALVEELRIAEQLEMVGGDRAINWYTAQARTKSEALEASEIVIELANKREQAAAAYKVANDIINGHDPADALAQLNEPQVNDNGFQDLCTVLDRVISGEHKKLVPTILRRSDNEHLLYPGRYSTVFGPPEAAKSWLLAEGVIQLAQAGQVSITVDAEDAPSTFVERLHALCLGNDIDLEQLREWLSGENQLIYYRQDHTGLSTKVRAQLMRLIKSRNARLVVLDGFNALLSAAEADENSSSDVARFISGRIAPLTNSEQTAVVTIDHVVKTAPPGGGTHSRLGARGSGHKIAAVSGAAYRIEVVTPGSAFAGGTYKLYCEKDRPGRLKVSRQGAQRIASVMVTSPKIDMLGRETTTVTLRSPDEIAEENATKRWDLICAEQISRLLSATTIGMTKTEIREALKEAGKSWHTTTTSQAFAFLESFGYVSVETIGRTSTLTNLATYKAEMGEVSAEDSRQSENPF